MEYEEELDLIKAYGAKLKANVIKVGHHGSITSSSIDFLELVKADYYLISVGKNNRYNLPNNDYLLKKENLYRTDINKCVIIRQFKNKVFISA